MKPLSKISFIRNFSIIAHIDHGKSTLADRLIQFCNSLEEREIQEQMLDTMDLEKERGITIKAQTVRLSYQAKDGHTYQLNLIDTPGHVDFAYEVSRSLAACEGSLLVIDASQGVEAQTLSNVYQAIESNHEIIPVLNKIDLPSAEPEMIRKQIEDIIGISTHTLITVSAKKGLGIKDVLESIVHHLPQPTEQDDQAPLQALLIDSWYDSYLGVILLIRIMKGTLYPGLKIHMLSTKASYTLEKVGIFTPKKKEVSTLSSGEIGYIVANIKSVSDCQIGDTITEEKRKTPFPLPGFKPSIPVVFCGLFPADSKDFQLLRESLSKLQLNDSSFVFEMESSSALGLGFRCGFLGLLHLEIIQERLEREFNLDLVITAPSVIYKVYTTDNQVLSLHNPADIPDATRILKMEEPWIRATILVPDTYLGHILELCTQRRGIQVDLTYTGNRAMLIYRLPLNEIVFDFYDYLKSLSKGYASFEYHADGYHEGPLVKLSILVNGDPVDALSSIVHKARSESRGRFLCTKLKNLIPRQLFKIALQAAIGSKIVARETISALRKDVTAKCYGGDSSRKRKLLDKQKEGKKRMRKIGNVSIPKSAFLEALKRGED